MKNLANADMLDDSIANSGTLKNQRLNKTAKMAVNPNPKPQPQQENANEESEEEESNEQREDYGKTKPNYSSNNRNTKTSTDNASDEKKILGMKPVMFYTLLGVAVIVGGIFLYKKYGKKGKGKIPSAPANAGTGSATPTPEIKVTP
jgi:uncharacterized membrane protein